MFKRHFFNILKLPTTFLFPLVFILNHNMKELFHVSHDADVRSRWCSLEIIHSFTTISVSNHKIEIDDRDSSDDGKT